MTTITRQRGTILTLCFAGFLLFAAFRAKRKAMMDLFLQELSEEQRLRYYYMMALRDMSNIVVTPPTSVQEVLAYISEHTPTECPACLRWYASEVGYCPDHAVPTRDVSHTEFARRIGEWEQFKQKYMGQFHIKTMPRRTIIKLLHWQENPERSA